MIFNKKYIVLIGILLITGCSQEKEYDYLLTHPSALKKEVERCDKLTEINMVSLNENDKKYCELVMYAAANMISILNEQQDDPQKFGEKIMMRELAVVKTRELIRTTKETLATKTDSNNQKLIEKQLADAEDSYRKQVEEMKLFLAVMSLSSPE